MIKNNMNESFEPKANTKREDEISVPLGYYKLEMERISDLNNQIAKQKELLEAEKDEEKKKIIELAIKTLKEETLYSNYRAGDFLNKHNQTTKILVDFEPDESDGKA